MVYSVSKKSPEEIRRRRSVCALKPVNKGFNAAERRAASVPKLQTSCLASYISRLEYAKEKPTIPDIKFFPDYTAPWFQPSKKADNNDNPATIVQREASP